MEVLAFSHACPNPASLDLMKRADFVFETLFMGK